MRRYGATFWPQLVQNLAPAASLAPQWVQNFAFPLATGASSPVSFAPAGLADSALPASNMTAVVEPVLTHRGSANSLPPYAVTSVYLPSGSASGRPNVPSKRLPAASA